MEPKRIRPRRGDTREDGKRFWGVGGGKRPREWWVTPEKYDALVVRYRETRRESRKDPVRNLADRVRTFALRASRYAKQGKPSSSFEILGTSLQEFKEYIESQFTDGMSWDLFGKHIHIDHITPLSSASTPEEVWELAHYENLRPMWATDNLRKGSKMPFEMT